VGDVPPPDAIVPAPPAVGDSVSNPSTTASESGEEIVGEQGTFALQARIRSLGL
jgi:hypothetical protein